MSFVSLPSAKKETDSSSFIHSAGGTGDVVICKSPDKLQMLIASLAKEKHVHYVSDGDWSTHDLINQLLKQHAPAELYITTYAIREFSVRQLVMAIERKELMSVHMIVDYRAQIRTPDVYQLASMNMSKIYLTAIHAKVTVLRTATSCITIVGSSNLTSNPRIEAGVISMDNAVGNFHINWIQKVMDHAEIFK